MRLWHKELIQVLPRQQLLGQWRECCAIAKNIHGKGTPNHLLVNRIMDYPLSHFLHYGWFVYAELQYRRGYDVEFFKFSRWINQGKVTGEYPFFEDIFSNWHNRRYLDQCYYNLEEKYDCGGITEDEWKAIRTYVLFGYVRSLPNYEQSIHSKNTHRRYENRRTNRDKSK